MSTYVGIETSPEALAEEEELIEAVEALVGVVSTSIWAEIVNEIEEFLTICKDIMYAICPLLAEYTSGTRSFHDDLQKITFFLVISMIAVIFFSPNITICFWNWNICRRLFRWRYYRRQRRRLEEHQLEQQQQNHHDRSQSFSLRGHRSRSYQQLLTPEDQHYYTPDGGSIGSSSPNHQHLWHSSSPALPHPSLHSFDHLDWSTSSNYNNNNNNYYYTSSSSYDWDATTVTDEERFQKMWPTIHCSKYRKLLLPPTCRRIPLTITKIKSDSTPRSSNSTTISSVSTRKAAKGKTKTKTSDLDEDNPYIRIQNYIRQLWYFIRSILSYDYTRAGWTLITWLQSLQRIHQYRTSRSRSQSTDDLLLPEEQSTVIVSNEAMTGNNNNHQNDNAEVVEQYTHILDSGSTLPDSHDNKVVSESFNASDLLLTDEQMTKTYEEFSEIDTDDTDMNTTNDDDSNHNNNKLPLQTIPTSTEKEEFSPLRENTSKTDSASISMIRREEATSDGAILKATKGNASQILETTIKDERSNSTTNMPRDVSSLHTSNCNEPAPDIISNNKSNSISSNDDEYDDDNVILERHPSSEKIGSMSLENDPDPRFDLREMTDHPLRNETMQQESLNGFFDAAATQESILQTQQQQLSVEVLHPDKHGYIVSEHLLLDSRNDTPLLVFVNSRSGPQQGHILITQLRRLLNPIQVWDLADGGPENILESFSVFSRLRVLVCGGDGSVAWIINALEKLAVYNYNNKKKNHSNTNQTSNYSSNTNNKEKGRKFRKITFHRSQASEHESERGTHQPKTRRQWPPIAILPLGTGNDLARIHGWGGGYNNESLINILEQIAESYASLLDRWELTITDARSRKTETKNFCNYLGVGADAQAALQVHNLRETRPDWFFSRLVNKAMYALFGAEDIIKASNVHTRKDIKLIADGVPIPLPLDSQGIILLNIDAYAGGVPLWSHGTKEVFPNEMINKKLPPRRIRSLTDVDKSQAATFPSSCTSDRQDYTSLNRIDSIEDFQNLPLEERFACLTACDLPSSCQDGILDVVSIRGAFHLGQIKVGLSNAQRLCQCREAKIFIKNKVAVQVDGEPWRQSASTLTIKRKEDHAVMLHRSADDGGVEMEMSKLLDWAEERKMIDSQVHSILMKEFSRRIESKKRQRRVRHKDSNIMSTLKKAISSGAMAGNLSGTATQSQWHGGGGLYF